MAERSYTDVPVRVPDQATTHSTTDSTKHLKCHHNPITPANPPTTAAQQSPA